MWHIDDSVWGIVKKIAAFFVTVTMVHCGGSGLRPHWVNIEVWSHRLCNIGNAALGPSWACMSLQCKSLDNTCCSYLKSNDQIRFQFCTCHDRSTVVPFTKNVSWWRQQNKNDSIINLHKSSMVSLWSVCGTCLWSCLGWAARSSEYRGWWSQPACRSASVRQTRPTGIDGRRYGHHWECTLGIRHRKLGHTGVMCGV